MAAGELHSRCHDSILTTLRDPSLQLEAAIHRQTDASDGACLQAGQPDVGVGDVPGINQAAQGRLADEGVQYLVGYRLDQSVSW